MGRRGAAATLHFLGIFFLLNCVFLCFIQTDPAGKNILGSTVTTNTGIKEVHSHFNEKKLQNWFYILLNNIFLCLGVQPEDRQLERPAGQHDHR